jgi:sporulation protein YlmC with PRC-barrel domain
MRGRLTAAALALLFGASQAVAQTATTPTVSPTFVTQQPAGEWLVTHFLGAVVTNTKGESIGDINDVVFDTTGRISTAVLGVGGFLGVGEKSVAVPFKALTLKVGPGGTHIIEVALSKEALLSAPAFTPTEKTMFMKAQEKASELMGQAKKKVEDMTTTPKPK